MLGEIDKFGEECAVAGVIGHPEAAHHVYLSLYALQHRGQEGSGIVSFSDTQSTWQAHKAFGLVRDIFSAEVLGRLEGRIAVGHNRYPTMGGRVLQNLQPFTFKTAVGQFALAKNGQLTNADSLRRMLESEGSIFQSTSDSEIFMHLFAKQSGSVLERLSTSMQAAKGAFSVIVVGEEKLYAMRDAFGFRPLVLGRLQDAYVVVSETCALDLIGAEYVRDIAPGELLEIDLSGNLKSVFPLPKRKAAFCAFESIYFSRPDSNVAGEAVYSVRRRLGTELAHESHEVGDIVVPVPDSGVAMAVGYAEAAKISLELGLIRNHYVGRTFIEPAQSIRDFGVKLKLNPVASVIKDRKVVVVDDSLVRGTTSIKIVRMLREAGAREIHMRIGSPPITHSCFFGVDTPRRDNLLAAQCDVEEMRRLLGVDSLGFLSLEGLEKVLGERDENHHCFACFNGNYPEKIETTIPDAPTDARGGPGLLSFGPNHQSRSASTAQAARPKSQEMPDPTSEAHIP